MTPRLEIIVIILDNIEDHLSCNLAYKIPKYIPIVFRNLNGYDAHLFIRELGKKFNKSGIGVIAENNEKCISFTIVDKFIVDKYRSTSNKLKEKKIQLRFIDSVRSWQVAWIL